MAGLDYGSLGEEQIALASEIFEAEMAPQEIIEGSELIARRLVEIDEELAHICNVGDPVENESLRWARKMMELAHKAGRKTNFVRFIQLGCIDKEDVDGTLFSSITVLVELWGKRRTTSSKGSVVVYKCVPQFAEKKRKLCDFRYNFE